MKTWEALKAMEEGKKVYRSGWKNIPTMRDIKYWHMSGQEIFNNEFTRGSITNCYWDDWEIYRED